MKHKRKALVLTTALAMTLGSMVATPAMATPLVAEQSATSVDRYSGKDRYETAVNISAKTFTGGSSTVYIATGSDFPDALAGASAAGTEQGPVLLVQSKAIPKAVKDEITRLNPEKIVILGGTGVVSKGVEKDLKTLAGEVVRYSGQDRYETAASISKNVFAEGSDTVYIAHGGGFADALAGAAAAGKNKGPVLLVQTNKIPASVKAELDRIKPANIVVLGGTGVVSAKVSDELKKYSAKVERFSGKDRFETAAAISKAVFDEPGGNVYLANGMDFPDALAGAAAAGTLQGPVLLVQASSVPTEVTAELNRLKPAKTIILGGEGVVSKSVKNSVEGKPSASDGSLTPQQKAAAAYAESLLTPFMAFSRTTLITNVVKEGFSEEDATAGVDSLNIDWNEQAYDSIGLHFQNNRPNKTRQGMLDTLTESGFSEAQAEYAVTKFEETHTWLAE